jgi:hypothetical protein
VQMGCGGLCRAMIGVRPCPNFHAPLEVWGAEYRSQGLIWDFAVVGGSAPAGSRDGSAALVLDRLARVRLDRAPRPITGIERHGDPGIYGISSLCSAARSPLPGHRGRAEQSFPRSRDYSPDAADTTLFVTPRDTPALARRPGETTLDLPQARARDDHRSGPQFKP